MRGGHCLKVWTKKQQVVHSCKRGSQDRIGRTGNPELKESAYACESADLMTKPLPKTKVEQLLKLMRYKFVGIKTRSSKSLTEKRSGLSLTKSQ